MKKVGFLIFCLFAMCSMAGKAQDVVAGQYRLYR